MGAFMTRGAAERSKALTARLDTIIAKIERMQHLTTDLKPLHRKLETARKELMSSYQEINRP